MVSSVKSAVVFFCRVSFFVCQLSLQLFVCFGLFLVWIPLRGRVRSQFFGVGREVGWGWGVAIHSACARC